MLGDLPRRADLGFVAEPAGDALKVTALVAGSPAELGLTVSGLVLSGDSAGGNLTIVTAMALRDAPAAVPVIAQFPIYPTVDRADAHGSYELFGEGRLLTKDGMKWFDEAYAATPGDWRGCALALAGTTRRQAAGRANRARDMVMCGEQVEGFNGGCGALRTLPARVRSSRLHR